MPPKRPPKLRQRSNGSLYAYFYDPDRSPSQKKVYLGVVIDEDLEETACDAMESKQGTDYLFGGSRSETFCTRRLSRVVKKYIKQAEGVKAYGLVCLIPNP